MSLEVLWKQLEWKEMVNEDFGEWGLGRQCLAPRISSGVQGRFKAWDKLSNNQRSLTKQTECLPRMRGDLIGSQLEFRGERECTCIDCMCCMLFMQRDVSSCFHAFYFSHTILKDQKLEWKSLQMDCSISCILSRWHYGNNNNVIYDIWCSSSLETVSDWCCHKSSLTDFV